MKKPDGCGRAGITALTLGVAVIAWYWAVATFPTPAKLLSDHGQGYQLAGASEILAGRHPFINFKDIYGPLTHYASALAQWLAGGRVGGELLLASLAFAISGAILFRLMVRCEIPVWLALTATLVAIVVQPVSWRYYMLLLPMLFFASAWRYVDTPTGKRLAVMALAVTVAGLFRPDLGVFTCLAGCVLIGTTPDDRRQPGWRIAAFLGLVFLWAMPWLGWLTAHGQLLGYLKNSSLDAVQDTLGRTRPPPSFDFSDGFLNAQNAKAYFFRLPALMGVFAMVMLVIRRAELCGPLRARLFCAVAFAALTQLQGSHTVDWMHVRDTLPLRIFLLAWVAAAVPWGSWRFQHLMPRAVVATIGVSLVAAATSAETFHQLSPASVVQKLRDYRAGRDEMLADVRRGGTNFRAQLYEYVRDHSASDEAIFAVIEAPQINYFANRRLAGGQLSIFPGYFSSPEDQRELIDRIRTERTAFVVIDHLGMDEYPDLSLEKYAPEFYAFIEREFVQVASIGYTRVLTPRWRSGDSNTEVPYESDLNAKTRRRRKERQGP